MIHDEHPFRILSTMNNNNNNSNIDQLPGNITSVAKGDSVTCITEGQVSFFDAEPGFTTTVESHPDPTYNVGATSATDIAQFLGRPLEIKRWSDGLGAVTVQDIFPWEAYFDNALVKKKLDNFALIRCKLHVKILVNAAPIWWGMSALSYTPQLSMVVYDSGDATPMTASQRPHVYINPTTSQGGCLCLPFFHNSNWLDLSDKDEFTNMGRLRFQYMSSQGLRCSTNPTSQKVEYTVFAWATDVVMSQTTTAVSMQADEYATGPVSSVASSVANVAGKLTSVPWLKPYAKATEIGASAIGRIAHIFGFSRPAVLDNPSHVMNEPFGQMANCGTHELVDRIVLDTKNELCIDSRTVGLDGTDEMGISSIATRESFIGVAFWRENDSAEDRLFIARVTPSMVVSTGTHSRQPTTLDFVSRPFQYWRGDIIYRIVVAASKFHRGRLIVQWDPHARVDGGTPVNAVASQILDLSVSRDMEFRVPYAAHTPFLLTAGGTNNYTPKAGFRDTLGGIIAQSPDKEYDNGSLSIRVLNPATGMSDTNEYLDVMVFVRGADNFEVAAPINFHKDLKVVGPGYSLQADEISTDFSPVSDSPVPIIPTNSVDQDATYSVCMGEKITSFRALLKRYNYAEIITFSNDPTAGIATVLSSTRSRWPLPRGRMDDGIDDFVSGPGNITNLTLFNYLQGAFVGMRGSSRWKFNTLNSVPTQEISVMRETLKLAKGTYSTHFTVSSSANPNEVKQQLLPHVKHGGYSLTNGNTQIGVQVEFPQYSRYRFISASPYSIPLGQESQDTDTDSITLRTVQAHTGSLDRFIVTAHHAVGDDFSLFFFLRTPIYYVNTESPAA